MCGIWALIGELMEKQEMQKYVNLLKNRGPEGEKIYSGPNYQLGFTRLALNGLNEAGMQPMLHQGIRWVCNGEIYNWKELANQIGFVNKSGSDCAVIGPLYKDVFGLGGFFRSLHGVFAMVIVDGDNIIVARDPYGVRPLFISKTESRIILASELKAIPTSETVTPFPPGHYATINADTLEIVYYQYHTLSIIDLPSSNVFETLKHSLITAVKRRMLTERPIAALLSGGLDSSLIAALVQQELKKSKKCLETYSIGFHGSEDLKYARMVAQHIGSTHTEIVMTPNQFFDAIPKVISDIESYDITTVRASVGNWLVAKEIAKLSQCKVVFNGDGSDEVIVG
jgi:asparagine synthase (glutamine-hydrolysing)